MQANYTRTTCRLITTIHVPLSYKNSACVMSTSVPSHASPCHVIGSNCPMTEYRRRTDKRGVTTDEKKNEGKKRVKTLNEMTKHDTQWVNRRTRLPCIPVGCTSGKRSCSVCIHVRAHTREPSDHLRVTPSDCKLLHWAGDKASAETHFETNYLLILPPAAGRAPA